MEGRSFASIMYFKLFPQIAIHRKYRKCETVSRDFHSQHVTRQLVEVLKYFMVSRKSGLYALKYRRFCSVDAFDVDAMCMNKTLFQGVQETDKLWKILLIKSNI